MPFLISHMMLNHKRIRAVIEMRHMLPAGMSIVVHLFHVQHVRADGFPKRVPCILHTTWQPCSSAMLCAAVVKPIYSACTQLVLTCQKTLFTMSSALIECLTCCRGMAGLAPQNAGANLAGYHGAAEKCCNDAGLAWHAPSFMMCQHSFGDLTCVCCIAEGEGKSSKPVANNSMVTAVALFDKAGELIYVGQSKGTITVLDSVSLKFLDVVKVCTCSVKHSTVHGTITQHTLIPRHHSVTVRLWKWLPHMH